MKRFTKVIAGICASVMLLTACLTAGVSAAPATPATDLSSIEMYMLENLPTAPTFPDGSYYLPNGMIVTPSQANDLYAKYYWYWYLSNGKPVAPIYPYPGYSVVTQQIEIDQYQTVNIPFNYNPAYTYSTTNAAVVAVDSYGRLFGIGAGEAHVTVAKDGYVIAIVKVTVKAAPAGTAAPVKLVLAATASTMKVGNTANVYAYVTVNGYPNTFFQYELEYAVSDDKVIKFDPETKTVTALAAGKATLDVTIKGTKITESVAFRVYETVPSYPTYPNYPTFPNYPVYPNLPVYPGIIYPGLVYPGIVLPDIFWEGFIGNEVGDYTIEYTWRYIGGEWKVVPVLVPKDSDKTDDKTDDTTTTPSTPTLTPEELEEIKKQEEEAKRLAELKANIVLALEGKLEWHEVYSDIYGNATYSAGVNYVLDNQLLTGNDDGTFTPYAKMTYGDVEKLFCKYLTLSTAEFRETGILTYKNAEDVIDREAIALAFYNMAKYLKLDTSATKNLSKYTDVKSLDDNCAAAFEWAVVNKVISITSTKLNPDKVVTKADLAQMMYRFNNFAK